MTALKIEALEASCLKKETKRIPEGNEKETIQESRKQDEAKQKPGDISFQDSPRIT